MLRRLLVISFAEFHCVLLFKAYVVFTRERCISLVSIDKERSGQVPTTLRWTQCVLLENTIKSNQCLFYGWSVLLSP